MAIIDELNQELQKIFDKLNYNSRELAYFLYSNRPDLGDFQTNCAMSLGKQLKTSPLGIARIIGEELKKSDKISLVSADGPGFINIKISERHLLNYLNKIMNSPKCGLEHGGEKKTVVADYGGFNIAKELHVGHLRPAVIGDSIRRIYEFAGDRVIGDVHLGDWGLNMGMTIQGIKLKYPGLKCFQNGFDGEKIDDLNITSADLTELYKLANAKAKEDKAFMDEVRLATKRLQDGFKPHRALWKYFKEICVKDLQELVCDTLDIHFDLWNGESDSGDTITQIIRNLMRTGQIIISDGAKIIDLAEYGLPPLIMEKSDGAALYASSDVATVLDRVQKYNPDLILYVMDFRQELHIKQVFAACEKINILNREKNKLLFCPFGTVNGEDGKPYKTRSGENVKLRSLVEEVTEKIAQKTAAGDESALKNIAGACIKFADLINHRESSYILNTEQFTNYDGKTGAYLLYGIVRINSILQNQEIFDYNITEVRAPEERDLMVELSKFNLYFEMAYDKQSPNIIAEYVFELIKKFSAFYAKCPINSEKDLAYRRSKISLLTLTKKIAETCLYLLGIKTVERM
ncbi:MAG: arginine--tRNA ligase [Rickettsiales bacterium]|jgi:arginyl-tRNA synthetase|nr:arginine--tRNA ligase [Rickettsiales bacterium]